MLSLINSCNYMQPALLNDAGQSLTYGELQVQITLISKLISKRRLVFLLGKNDFPSVHIYLACLEKDSVPLLLDPEISVIMLSNLVDLYRPTYIFISKEKSNLFSFSEILYESDDYFFLKNRFSDDSDLNPNLALLLTTSGSSGSPKLVRLSKDNIFSNTDSIIKYLSIDQSQRAVTSLPLNYSYGMSVLNSHLRAGASVFLTNRSFFEAEFWRSMKSYAVTSLAGVPYSYEILLKLRFERMDLPTLQTLTQAGGKMSLALTQRLADICQEKGIRFFTMYGQTEASPRMAFLNPNYLRTKFGSIGKAIPGGHLWLEDEQGKIIKAPDKVGELVYSGPNVALGYAEHRKDLKAGDDWGGTLRTGDLARVDTDGFFYIEGRKNRFLKIFGVRVSLDAVEDWYAKKHLTAAAHGHDDHLRVTIEGVDNDCIDGEVKNLASAIQIHSSALTISFLPKLPRLGSGKVDYQCLNKIY